jgi:lipopolysaccharide export system permease protein
MMPILALLAIPYCRVKPREGKFARVLPGLLIYIVYTASLMYTRTAIENGNWPFWLGLWPIHGLVAAYGWYLLQQFERVLQNKS